MVTIADVARQAEVSPATITRYLAGQRIRAHDRVEQVIRELDYRPNSTARSLRSGRFGAIGVVVPDVANPYFASLVKGIESVARDAGYHVILSNTDEGQVDEERLTRGLRSRVDGLILVPASESDDGAERGVRDDHYPVVYVDRRGGDAGKFDSVLADNHSGIHDAVAHLARLGHQRIALVAGPRTSTPGRERYESFLDACQEHGIDQDRYLVQFADFKEQGGYEAAQYLMTMVEPPTAVIISNNLMTFGALKFFARLGVSVPSDISVIGFDDFGLADLLSTPLTVIARDEVEQGRLAAVKLVDRMLGNVDPPEVIRIPTALVTRRSTGRVRSTSSSLKVDDHA